MFSVYLPPTPTPSSPSLSRIIVVCVPVDPVVSSGRERSGPIVHARMSCMNRIFPSTEWAGVAGAAGAAWGEGGMCGH
jgi:hypothetical protein